MRLKLQQQWLVMILLLVLVPPMKSQDTAKEAVTVTGKWTVSIQGQHGPRTQKMTLQQDGNKISGSIQGNGGDQDLQGTVEGNNIHFTVSVNTPRGAMTLEYLGTIQGHSMKGSIQGPIGRGSWSATRDGD